MAASRLEYTVVWAHFFDKLELVINNHLAQGWEPLGGPGATPGDDDYLVFQAMTRKVPNENPTAS